MLKKRPLSNVLKGRFRVVPPYFIYRSHGRPHVDQVNLDNETNSAKANETGSP